MRARELYKSLAYLGKTQQNWAFFHLTGQDYGQVFIDNPDFPVDKRLEEIGLLYSQGLPLAYILGEAYFYGRRFEVSEDVLIPRPETEGLVERALELKWDSALDLCTGSGVIAISLALERPSSRIRAVDISPKALEVARTNGKELGAEVVFLLSDLYEEVEGSYELIISNPPYIKRGALESLEVARQEPLLALDGGEEGLDIIERIFDGAHTYLKPGGYLLLEIGDDHEEDIVKLTQGFYGKIERDLAGKVRYYIGRKI